MWMVLLACTLGEPGPATAGSPAAEAAEKAQSISDKAGAIANAARELEQMSDPARERVAAGGDPAAEIAKMRQTMEKIERLEQSLRDELQALEAEIPESASAQSGAQRPLESVK